MGCMHSSVIEDKTIKSTEEILIRPGMFVKLNPRTRVFCEEYSMVRCIGEGGFSKVHLCTHKSLGVQRAVKIFSKNLLMSREARTQFRNELGILRSLDHPNIIKAYEAFEDSENYYLVMEHCQGGELFTKILQSQTFSEEEVAKIMKQLFSCIAYLHSHNIAHRDIKPENILFDEDVIKIIDFGNSTKFKVGSHLTEKIGSPYYIAPEVCAGKYSELCDLWSAGVILYILLRKEPPFNGGKPADIIRKVRTGKYNLTGKRWEKVSAGARLLVQNLLVPEDSRMSAWQAMNDSWINSVETLSEPSSIVFQHVMSNMSSANNTNKLVDAVQMFITTQLLTNKEASDAKAIFRAIDKDGDGKLSKSELEVAFRRFKNDPLLANEETERVMSSLYTYNSEFVDYTEFLRATVDSVVNVSEERLETAFSYFDLDRNGEISMQELRDTLSGQANSDPSVWENIVKSFDHDGSTIGLREFKDVFRKQFK